MRTPKLIILLLLISIAYTPVIAQTNYLPGYYINSSSDTVRGFIESRGESKMSWSIRYKSQANSKAVRLYPKNTKTVVIDNASFYESLTVERGDETLEGFFKVRAAGRMTLYVFRDDDFFVRKGDGELYDITLRRNIVDRHYKYDYRGLGHLKNLTSDCPTLSEQFLNDQYKVAPDYAMIVNLYNRCFTGENIDVPTVKIERWTDFGVQGSVVATMNDFSETSRMSDANFATRFLGAGGLYASVFFPHMGNNIRVNVEPSFGLYNGYSNFQNFEGVNDVYLRFSYVRMPVYMRYFFVRSLFVDFGINNMFLIKQNNEWRQESIRSTGTVFTEDGPGYLIKSRPLGAMAGLGTRINIGSIPTYASVRFSHLFLTSRGNQLTQPVVQWLEFNLAVQLTRKK